MHDNKKLIILAQVFISCLMAFLMTGIMGYLNGAFTQDWHISWASGFAMAWPIAFLLSMIVWPISFRAAMGILTLTAKIR